MDVTNEEQRLITDFRRLSPSGRDELLACAASLLRRTGVGTSGEPASNQCSLKQADIKPETRTTPIFTE